MDSGLSECEESEGKACFAPNGLANAVSEAIIQPDRAGTRSLTGPRSQERIAAHSGVTDSGSDATYGSLGTHVVSTVPPAQERLEIESSDLTPPHQRRSRFNVSASEEDGDEGEHVGVIGRDRERRRMSGEEFRLDDIVGEDFEEGLERYGFDTHEPSAVVVGVPYGQRSEDDSPPTHPSRAASEFGEAGSGEDEGLDDALSEVVEPFEQVGEHGMEELVPDFVNNIDDIGGAVQPSEPSDPLEFLISRDAERIRAVLNSPEQVEEQSLCLRYGPPFFSTTATVTEALDILVAVARARTDTLSAFTRRTRESSDRMEISLIYRLLRQRPDFCNLS